MRWAARGPGLLAGVSSFYGDVSLPLAERRFLDRQRQHEE
jgi:hypothetical protein